MQLWHPNFSDQFFLGMSLVDQAFKNYFKMMIETLHERNPESEVVYFIAETVVKCTDSFLNLLIEPIDN